MLRILHVYRGALTNERVIEPGDYADDAPALFGLAAYLLANGHAVSVEDAPPPPDDEPVFTHAIELDAAGNPIKGEQRPLTNEPLKRKRTQ